MSGLATDRHVSRGGCCAVSSPALSARPSSATSTRSSPASSCRGMARAARRWSWRQTLLSLASCLREPPVQDIEAAERITVRSAVMQDRRGFRTDLRSAIRFCARRPLMSLTVVLTLAVGIGVNAAVFSGTERYLPQDVADSGRSTGSSNPVQERRRVHLSRVPGAQGRAGADGGHRGGRTSTTLDSAVGEGRTRQRVVIDIVTANYFDALAAGNARSALHRGRRPSLDASCRRPEPRGLAQALRIDVGVIGRTVRLHRGIFTVAGVAPDGFTGTQIGYSPDVWVPLTHALHRRQHRDAWSRFRMARTEWRARAARHADDGARGDRWPMEGGPKW